MLFMFPFEYYTTGVTTKSASHLTKTRVLTVLFIKHVVVVAWFAAVSKRMAASVVRSNVTVHDYNLFNDAVSN
jgi:hypothetical protein